jgi:hypothetical protein
MGGTVDYAFQSHHSRLAELAVREASKTVPSRSCREVHWDFGDLIGATSIAADLVSMPPKR